MNESILIRAALRLHISNENRRLELAAANTEQE